MTEGEAINAAWADHFAVCDAMRPMSAMQWPDVVYFVDKNLDLHWAVWSEYYDGWVFTPEDCDAGFNETQAIGWLPA